MNGIYENVKDKNKDTTTGNVTEAVKYRDSYLFRANHRSVSFVFVLEYFARINFE